MSGCGGARRMGISDDDPKEPPPPDPQSITPGLLKYFSRYFPKLKPRPETFTSRRDETYNCFAFAAGELRHRWVPVPLIDDYWPEGVPMDTSIGTFIRAYATAGFEPCQDGEPAPGWQKIALYAKDERVTHAARQMPDGTWRSKIGPFEDITHPLDALTDEYGTIAAFLRRLHPRD